MNYEASESIKARIESLEAAFERDIDTAPLEQQQEMIDMIDNLRDKLAPIKYRKIGNWSDSLAAGNID